MESYFDVMAQNPHCILAVDAQDGGKWKSPFQLPHYISYAQNSKYWTNFNSFFNTDDGIKYTDDFEFEMEFYWNYTEEEMAALTGNVHLFYNTFGNTPIGILVSNTTGKLSVFPSGSTVSSTAGGVASTSLVSKGKYTLKYFYKFSTGSMTLVLNGVEVSSVLPTTNRTDFNVSQINRSFFNGNIHYITLTKTTGDTRTLIWEANQFDLKSNLAIAPTAPLGTGSFEEQHGLLKKINVIAENDYFKFTQALGQGYGFLETPVDLRGYSGDFTMIGKVSLNAESGYVYAFYQDATSVSISKDSNTFTFTYVDVNQTTWRTISYTLPPDFDWYTPHVLAATRSAAQLKIYLDGVLVNTVNFATTSIYNGAMVKMRVAQMKSSNNKTYSAMIFDKALSADEIKILSDSLLPKKHAARYVPFMTPSNLTANDSDSEWIIYAANGPSKISDTSACVDPNAADAWKAAAGIRSSPGWTTDRFSGSDWDVVLGWRRKDGKKFFVTKVTVGLCSKMPIYYGYYKWYGNRVERLDGSTVIYGGDFDFSCDEEWIIQTIYGEKTFERTKPFDPPDYLNSGGCFELRFNAGIDPSLVGLKSLGLNLLQLEGLIIN